MSILTTSELDNPAVSIPVRSRHQVIGDFPHYERPLVRCRIRLDDNEFPARVKRIVAQPSPTPSTVPNPHRRHRRSCLGLVERALRDSPANLRTTLVGLGAIAVLIGIMVATLGWFAIGVIIGLSAMYKQLSR